MCLSFQPDTFTYHSLVRSKEISTNQNFTLPLNLQKASLLFLQALFCPLSQSDIIKNGYKMCRIPSTINQNFTLYKSKPNFCNHQITNNEFNKKGTFDLTLPRRCKAVCLVPWTRTSIYTNVTTATMKSWMFVTTVYYSNSSILTCFMYTFVPHCRL